MSHQFIYCDVTGNWITTGVRYHRRDTPLEGVDSFDVCQQVYDAISKSDQELYEVIPPPTTEGFLAEVEAFEKWMHETSLTQPSDTTSKHDWGHQGARSTAWSTHPNPKPRIEPADKLFSTSTESEFERSNTRSNTVKVQNSSESDNLHEHQHSVDVAPRRFVPGFPVKSSEKRKTRTRNWSVQKSKALEHQGTPNGGSKYQGWNRFQPNPNGLSESKCMFSTSVSKGDSQTSTPPPKFCASNGSFFSGRFKTKSSTSPNHTLPSRFNSPQRFDTTKVNTTKGDFFRKSNRDQPFQMQERHGPSTTEAQSILCVKQRTFSNRCSFSFGSHRRTPADVGKDESPKSSPQQGKPAFGSTCLFKPAVFKSNRNQAGLSMSKHQDTWNPKNPTLAS